MCAGGGEGGFYLKYHEMKNTLKYWSKIDGLSHETYSVMKVIRKEIARKRKRNRSKIKIGYFQSTLNLQGR